jgi:hypothetical protein
MARPEMGSNLVVVVLVLVVSSLLLGIFARESVEIGHIDAPGVLKKTKSSSPLRVRIFPSS